MDSATARLVCLYVLESTPFIACLTAGWVPSAGLTVAEHFRDAEGQDVLLFIDNIFRFTQVPLLCPFGANYAHFHVVAIDQKLHRAIPYFGPYPECRDAFLIHCIWCAPVRHYGLHPLRYVMVQANSEVSALLGRIPSAVGYQPTLATDLGTLQERITTTKKGSITSVQVSNLTASDTHLDILSLDAAYNMFCCQICLASTQFQAFVTATIFVKAFIQRGGACINFLQPLAAASMCLCGAGYICAC